MTGGWQYGSSGGSKIMLVTRTGFFTHWRKIQNSGNLQVITATEQALSSTTYKMNMASSL